MLRGLVVVGGLVAFVVILHDALDWAIARELLDRGYTRTSEYWQPARGTGLAWGGLIAAPGLVIHGGVVIGAWRRARFSAARLLALHGVAVAGALAGLLVVGSLGILVATPLASIAAFLVLRSDLGKQAS